MDNAQKHIALFLGAGASVPFDKPTTRELKEMLKTKYSNYNESEVTSNLLTSLLTFTEFLDIEHILQALKDIQRFSNDYGGKYIFDKSQHGIYHTGRYDIPLITLADESFKITKILEKEVFDNYSWKHDKDNDLIRLYDEIFRTLRKYSEEMNVFTTNYDRSIEQYCADKKYDCVDGFRWNDHLKRDLWTGEFFSENNSREDILYLYKLHGSLNWKLHNKYGIEKTSMEQQLTDPNYSEDILIYPTLSTKEVNEKDPYKTIFNRFKELMKSTELCIVIGFSFRDTHINRIFQDFLKKRKPLISISPTADNDIRTNLLRGTSIEEDIGNEIKQNDERGCGIICPNGKKLSLDTVQEIMKDIENYIAARKIMLNG
jgi:SIR2-like domain